MKQAFCRLGIVALAIGLGAVAAIAQVNPTGTLTGTITDASHAVVPGAVVQVASATTGLKLQTVTGANGHYSIGNVPPGTYTVAVTAKGFQTAEFQAVTLAANQVYSLNAVLKVGEVSSSVTVEAGQQVLETQQTAISTTISGPTISQLPSASSSSALYSLTQTDPAIQTMGAPRQSSAEGLPGGAINITIDGISAQWELGKSGDPIFTMITPNVSDTAEFDLTSAAGSAAQSGEGAVQISFISQRGTNQWHGGVWDYFRNDALNANYYFNNLSGQRRPVMRYNQWGFNLGGPILKNKLFFYFDISLFGQPEGSVQNSTILTPAAASGLFTYTPSTMPGSASPNSWTTCDAAAKTCTANLLAMAQNFGQPSTIDPFIGQTLATMGKAASASGVTVGTPPSPYQQLLAFPLSGKNQQQNPDFRLDYNLSQNHSLEFDYHLSRLVIFPDDLNGGGYTYPVAPFNTNQYGYAADRAIWAWAWRWTLGPTQSNELRFGFQNSPESFNYNETAAIYPTIATNLGSLRMRPVMPGEVTDPWLGYGPFQDWDNINQLTDNFAWMKGNHNLAFGFTLSRARYQDVSSGNVVASVNLGLSGFEPIEQDLNSTNLPGITAGDLSAAGDVYGLLTGNVTGYSTSVAFDPTKRQFVTGIPGRDQYHQTDLGFYGADSWRARPNFTVNYGLRWQYEGVPVDDLNEYFIPDGGVAAAYGVSGAGNLFKPGTMTGSVPTFSNDQGKTWYNNWYKGFAPSLGFAWQPQIDAGWWKALFGDPGQSVIRAGYSIAYSREGLENWNSIAASNPGYFGQQFANAAPAAANQPAGLYNAGSIQINNMNIPAVTQVPAAFQPNITLNPLSSVNFLNVIDPHLHMPYVQSWTFGLQRSLGPRTALEVRYVGNHAAGLWQQQNLNEVNIFENGFLNEFKNAEGNLAACMADATCSQNPSFADLGLANQVPLPIFTAAFNGPGSDAANASTQQAAGFTNGGTITQLQNGQAGSAASTLATTYNYWQNLIAAGYPKNFFTVNPDAIGGSYYLHNALQSTYNALVVAVRRRPLHGLTLNASYTWSKSLTNDWQRNGANYVDNTTLRDLANDKGPAPFDIRNAFKFYSLWELPVGHGQRWLNTSGLANTLLGGWSFDSNILLQSGRPGLLTGGLGGTFDQYDGGVILHGMSQQQLQNQLKVYKTSSPAPGAVWYFPQSMLGANGRFTNTSVLEACNTPGALCQRMFIYDPPLFIPNFSFVKHTQITERINSEIQVQFLDAFNNANFFWTGSAQTFGTAGRSLQSGVFGRITHAYQAVDSTSDYGGRTIQLIAKFTF